MLLRLECSHSYITKEKERLTKTIVIHKEKSSYQEATLKSCTEMEIVLDSIMLDYLVVKNYVLHSAATVSNFGPQTR